MTEPSITVYRDGPLMLRGDVQIVDQDGNVIEPNHARGVALCRCGKSRMRPFCDGTHNVIRFRAPGALESGRE